MVSYIQVEGYGLEQGFKGVVKPASGRPKSIQISEDADFFYVYTRSGKLEGATRKSDIDKYYDFLLHEASYVNQSTGQRGTLAQVTNHVTHTIHRTTPETEYEKSMGLGATNLDSVAKTLTGKDFGQVTRAKGKLKIRIDDLSRKHFLKLEEEKRKREEELERLRLEKIRQTAKPKKETVFVAEPEPIAVEPIKEVAKYSPLMIAGVIAVVVILFLRRRA